MQFLKDLSHPISPENPYEFIDGWLYHNGKRVPYVPAHDHSGTMQKLKGCVMHYGAGTFDSDTRMLTGDDHIYVSATLVLSRTGAVRQLTNLFTVAWHCGDGEFTPAKPYGGRTPNYCFAGIEMENLGWLNQQGQAGYAGRKGGVVWPISDTIRAIHPIRGGPAMWWPKYPAVQVQHADWIVEAMKDASKDFEFLVGHDEMSRYKYDPGPAYDMDRMRATLNLKGS